MMIDYFSCYYCIFSCDFFVVFNIGFYMVLLPFFLQFISFPSVSSSGGQKFSFSLSEIEGPAGSFECIQQSQGQLDVLGTLSNKMRIHANDDVYETTKHRMAVAEENQKNKW